MSSPNKWVRSISFNRKNPDDVRRLKFIGKKSFSRLVKRLIDEEIERTKSKVPNDTTTTATPQKRKGVVPNQHYQQVAPPKPKINSNNGITFRFGDKRYD